MVRATGNDLTDSVVDGLRRFSGFFIVGRGEEEESDRAVSWDRGGKAFSDGRMYSGMNGLGFDTGERARSAAGAFALAKGDW